MTAIRLCLKWAIVATMSVALVQVVAQEAKPAKSPEPKKDTRVEPTSWGHVYGRVYDAISGLPIKDARVLGYTDNGFEEKGKSVGATGALGEYHIQLVLGRISHNFDIGRALLSSPLGMLFGSATNTTKRIDVARVAVSVHAHGFKPFIGVVSARSTDAGKFRIDVEPILMVPDGQDGVSVAAKGWNAIRLVSASANPDIAGPKQKVKLEVAIRAHNAELTKSTEIVAYSDLWKGAKKLKLSQDPGTDGIAMFSGEYTVSGKERQSANRVMFAVSKAKVDFDPGRSSALVIVNVLQRDGDTTVPMARNEAIQLVRAGKVTEARDAFARLSSKGSKEAFDWLMAADLSMRIGDPAGAVEPAGNLWLANAKDAVAADRYVTALYEAGRDKDVIRVGQTLTKDIREKDLPKAISAQTLATVGLAYVRSQDLVAADAINEKLLKFQGSGIVPAVMEFRSKLRLAEVEKTHAANPKSAPALADFGRALLDLGRYEEAVAKLAEAAEVDPNQPTIQRDIAWAALQMRGGQKPKVDLERAVSEARGQLGLEKGQQRSKDFFSWNQYGLLLFAWSEEKRAIAATDADQTRDLAIETIREALTLGRVGAKRNSGYYSPFMSQYLTGSEVAISGFAYPQANASFLLLDSLRKLRRDDKDRVALYNAATSLLDLGQINMSSTFCDRLLALEPEHVEAMFVRSLILHQLDDLEKSRETLLGVIRAAPNHPRANLVLADILTELGDPVAASERAAAHASFYGDGNKR